MKHEVYIGLGSNLDNPILQLIRAIQHMSKIEFISIEKLSRFYVSAALNDLGQSDFINAVMQIKTSYYPYELLKILQTIELSQGRKRDAHWASRTLDLDILLYNEEIIHDDLLIIPHPALYQRNFWLYPLYEIAPNLKLPNGHFLQEIIVHISQAGLMPLLMDIF